jgi:hypothetical protein
VQATAYGALAGQVSWQQRIRLLAGGRQQRVNLWRVRALYGSVQTCTRVPAAAVLSRARWLGDDAPFITAASFSLVASS